MKDAAICISALDGDGQMGSHISAGSD